MRLGAPALLLNRVWDQPGTAGTRRERAGPGQGAPCASPEKSLAPTAAGGPEPTGMGNCVSVRASATINRVFAKL